MYKIKTITLDTFSAKKANAFDFSFLDLKNKFSGNQRILIHMYDGENLVGNIESSISEEDVKSWMQGYGIEKQIAEKFNFILEN